MPAVAPFYRFVGQKITLIDGEIDTTDSVYLEILEMATDSGLDTRFYLPSRVYTQEFRTNRITFYVNEDGEITRIRPG